jgi:3-deoxy-7-phosphoheptulonate synthase
LLDKNGGAVMINIAVLGYGTIGSGVVEVLNTNGDSIAKRAGDQIQVKYVLDKKEFPGDPIMEKLVSDVQVILDDPEVKIVVEVMGGVEPAFTFVKSALLKGKSVVTSNKELVATKGAELLKIAKEKTGLPIVTEVMTPALVEEAVEYADIIQIGARNMQNYDLLKEVGRTDRPILLKRGLAATIEEFLMSAEYIMAEGNENVILCERGIRTFETYTRNTLDISAVPILKKLSHLPVIVDPSHASGMWWLVEPLSMAAIAAGADGLIIEVHNDPANAMCDGEQSIKPERFDSLVKSLGKVAEAVGRSI